MNSAAISDQLPIDAGFAHLFFKCGYFSGRNERVVGAVQSEDLGFDRAGLGWNGSAEPAVKTYYARHVSAAARQLQSGTRAIVSGQAVLNFLARTVFPVAGIFEFRRKKLSRSYLCLMPASRETFTP
jgi:hypothetical protein